MRHPEQIVLSLLSVLLLFACNKEQQDAPRASFYLSFEHEVDGDSLDFSRFYRNAAGNQYRVHYLKYFISGVTLYRSGTPLFNQTQAPIAICARYTETLSLAVGEIPFGDYDSISFSLGLTPQLNQHNAFALNPDDYDMYWPANMGGGYHFMKFEGHWKDGGLYDGFAFHMGQNENLITFGFPINLEIHTSEDQALTFTMNVNQWFEDPYLYDLAQESGYTMGDTAKMNRLKQNGYNVFSLKYD